MGYFQLSYLAWRSEGHTHSPPPSDSVFNISYSHNDLPLILRKVSSKGLQEINLRNFSHGHTNLEKLRDGFVGAQVPWGTHQGEWKRVEGPESTLVTWKLGCHHGPHNAMMWVLELAGATMGVGVSRVFPGLSGCSQGASAHANPWPCPQFWSAYVPCQTQDQDALRLTLEQIDLIRRMCASYSELELVTSVHGGSVSKGLLRTRLSCSSP